MKKTVIMISVHAFLLIGTSTVYSQQDAMFIQNLDNQIYVNPGFAGSKEQMELTSVHRQQWVGVTGAPMTTTLSLHTPLKYKSLGIGVDLLNDRIGPLNRFSGSLDVSYRLHFKGGSKLSFGVKGGIDSYNSEFRKLDLTGMDPLAIDLKGATTPSFGVGAYYFAKKWFIGASIPRLTKDLTDKVGGLDNATHCFGVLGFLVPLGNKWQLRPASQIRYTSGAPLSTEITLTAIQNDRFWIGGMYRYKESFGGLIQFKMNNQIKFGYAADFPSTLLRTGNSGSHEILISYSFKKKEKGLVSPRYF